MKRILNSCKYTFFIVLILLLATPFALARFNYEIGEQHEILNVYRNGSIMLEKEFTFHVKSSSNENGTEVWVGLPTDDTSVISASYIINGKETPLKFKIEKGNDEQHVIFTNFLPIRPGETGKFHFYARIPDLIYWLNKDQLKKDTEEQLVSISYIPAWWDKAVTKSLTLEMSFENGIIPSDLSFATQQKPTQVLENRFIWEYSNIPADTRKKHAIILPRQFFSASMKPLKNWMPTWVLLLILAIILVTVLGTALLIIYSVKNKRYQTPVAYMKGDKAYTSFDPVEAAFFFNLPTDLTAKLIIIGLMKKNVIKLKDDIMQRVPTLESLTWYEEFFLDSIDKNVQIISDKWRENYPEMLGRFFKQIDGYCGRQTRAYYTKWLKDTTFTEKDDPRWAIIKEQLASGIFEKPVKERVQSTTPGYLNPYLPLIYLTVINPGLQKENKAHYRTVFPGETNQGGDTSGTGCACACACACASSGGCT